MHVRVLVGVAAVAVATAGAVLTNPSACDGAAQAAPARGARSTWTEADKSGFGTARTTRSNVWFTLQQGRVSEVFYPDLSTPSVRTLDFVVTDGHIGWADLIFVMEKSHLHKLQLKFGDALNDKRVITLHIPDDYHFMQPELIDELQAKVGPHLGPSPLE